MKRVKTCLRLLNKRKVLEQIGPSMALFLRKWFLSWGNLAESVNGSVTKIHIRHNKLAFVCLDVTRFKFCC